MRSEGNLRESKGNRKKVALKIISSRKKKRKKYEGTCKKLGIGVN